MSNPRLIDAGETGLSPEYGNQLAVVQNQRPRHHRHRKNKHGIVDASPISRDESIYKVDASRQAPYQQSDMQAAHGYGVPYGGIAYGMPNAGNLYAQQQQYSMGNFANNNQFQGNAFAQGQFGIETGGVPTKRHRRHHRRHRHHHGGEGASGATSFDQAPIVPDQLIGERSSSAGGRESRHHHRQHHQSHHSHSHSHRSRSGGLGDGYGHINDDLIFIERGDHSPHRQEPPSGYEYKGKIEVESIDREIRSESRGAVPIAPVPSAGPCPPGWQQVVLTSAGGYQCPSGGTMYTGQVATGGVGGFTGGAGSLGIGGGTGNTGGSYSYQGQGQLVSDYIVDGGAGGAGSYGGGISGGGISGGGISGGGISGGGGFSQFGGGQGHVSRRIKVIEVWQKRSKSETRDRSRSSSSEKNRSSDFDKFRTEIIAIIQRTLQNNDDSKINLGGKDDSRTSGGEVRVIVQPIQPVFYMPRQTEQPTPGPHVGPAPVVQPTQSGAPHIVYIPRNVYVPVIKPVFVPRERVIVRPQVIHVARPVLVDRPVPVTQRPIIIDRERPIPVPIRTAPQAAAQTGVSNVVQEEYVYRDNLPVAYGGRCADVAGGINYGYMPRHEQHQYATSSAYDAVDAYPSGGSVINVTVPNQFQQSHSASHIGYHQGAGGLGAGHGSFSNMARANSASVLNTQRPVCSAPMEVLDATVNSNWQRTDKASLVQRYGPPAIDIVQKTDRVEQEMYRELQQRGSGGVIHRSGSAGSFATGAGVTAGHVGGSFSSIPRGAIINCTIQGVDQQVSAPVPVHINY